MDRLGRRSVLTCPECHGVMWEIKDDDLVRYRYRVGHAYTSDAMKVCLDEAPKRFSARPFEKADNTKGGYPEPARGRGPLSLAAKHSRLPIVENDVCRHRFDDWLSAMGLISAGATAQLDPYIGYYETYSSNHAALDSDGAIQQETRNVARTLLEAVQTKRAGNLNQFGQKLRDPRPK